MSTSVPRSERTWAAVVGLTRPEPVRRRRRDRTAERVEEIAREWMIGNAQPDGVAPTGHLVGDRTGATPHHERERAGPERGGEPAREIGHVGCVLIELFGAGEMRDHGMCRWATLHGEQPLHRLLVRGVGAESVDGLGRERDEPARATCGGCLDLVVGVFRLRIKFVSIPVTDQGYQ